MSLLTMSTIDEQQVYTEILRDYLAVLKEYEVLDKNQKACSATERPLEEYIEKAKYITRKFVTLLDRALYPTVPHARIHLSTVFAKSIFDVLVALEGKVNKLMLRSKNLANK